RSASASTARRSWPTPTRRPSGTRISWRQSRGRRRASGSARRWPASASPSWPTSAPWPEPRAAAAASHPEQLVQPDLGPGLLVHALDDDRAVEAVAPVARGQRAGHDHGAGRHAAVGDLAGLTVVNARALPDEHAHRDDGAALDNNALDYLGARADEAVVLDDGGAGLHGLEHAADAAAAREVYVAPD